MPYPYITQADLESRFSTAALRRGFDDDNDGAADANPITRLIADASAKVAAAMRGKYDLDAVASSTPEEVKRLTLDVAHAYAALRHPSYVQADGFELMKLANAELKMLRNGEMRLDVEGTPEPREDVGGGYVEGDPDTFDATTHRPAFLHGFGDF